MHISVTERAEFRRCRRRWDYGSMNRQGLGRIVPAAALGLGSLIHQSLADWLVNPDHDLPSRFLTFASQAVEDARASYLKQVGAHISDDELGPLLDSVALGRDMMTNYQTHWGKPLMEGFEVLTPEQRVSVPIPGTEHYLDGKFDGLLRDKHGRIYVLEHKTYGQRPNVGSLNTNDQFLAYIWIASQLNLGPVAGIAYDGLWKRPAPPKGSQLPDLFCRLMLERPQDELDEFEYHLWNEVQDMAACANACPEPGKRYPKLYPNRRWEGCYDCEFEALCTTQSRGEDTDYIRSTMFMRRPKDEED